MGECKGSMIIKFLKSHPTSHGYISNHLGVGKYNVGSTIKAMNLIVQGYAKLIHSCKDCNPYHLDMEDFQKPFRQKNYEILHPDFT